GVRPRRQRLLLGDRLVRDIGARQARCRCGVRQLGGRVFELGDLLVEPVVGRRADLAESLGEAVGLRVRVGPRRGGGRGPGAAEPGQPAAAAWLALREECGHTASPPVAVRWARPRRNRGATLPPASGTDAERRGCIARRVKRASAGAVGRRRARGWDRPSSAGPPPAARRRYDLLTGSSGGWPSRRRGPRCTE